MYRAAQCERQEGTSHLKGCKTSHVSARAAPKHCLTLLSSRGLGRARGCRAGLPHRPRSSARAAAGSRGRPARRRGAPAILSQTHRFPPQVSRLRGRSPSRPGTAASTPGRPYSSSLRSPGPAAGRKRRRPPPRKHRPSRRSPSPPSRWLTHVLLEGVGGEERHLGSALPPAPQLRPSPARGRPTHCRRRHRPATAVSSSGPRGCPCAPDGLAEKTPQTAPRRRAGPSRGSVGGSRYRPAGWGGERGGQRRPQRRGGDRRSLGHPGGAGASRGRGCRQERAEAPPRSASCGRGRAGGGVAAGGRHLEAGGARAGSSPLRPRISRAAAIAPYFTLSPVSNPGVKSCLRARALPPRWV